MQGNPKLTLLLGELMALHDSQRDGEGHSSVCTPSRAAKQTDIGRSTPKYTVSPRVAGRDTTGDDDRMALLREQIISELAAQQSSADERNSPYSSEPYRLGSPGRTWKEGNAVSLPVGERVKATKTFGKRVFEGGIPPPLPLELGHGARFGKRMNIEAESHRRALDTAAISGRKPDNESIFAERYKQLRDGILSVDGRKPCIRLPSVERRGASYRNLDSNVNVVRGDKRNSYRSEYRRTVGDPPPVMSNENARVGLYFAVPTPPSRSKVRETITATGAVIATTPRHLLSRDEAPARPAPQTARSVAASL